MKNRLHLVILFLAVILIVLAQATSVAETRLLAESLKWSDASSSAQHIRYLIKVATETTTAENKESPDGPLQFEELKQKMLHEIDAVQIGDDRETEAIKKAIGNLNGAEPQFHLNADVLEGQLLALAASYNHRETTAWSQSRRYAVLSRISWFSFAFIATLLIYWNASLRGRVENELQQRDVQLAHLVDEATEDLRQEISRLTQLLEKLREE